MGYSNPVIWTIKELTKVLRDRQMNKFDCNIGVSGKRGNGKSTLLFKVFNSFKKQGFDSKKHQVYERDDVMRLLSTQKFGFCWDDEAINSGYKRDFQNKGQQELIKMVTNYRDNFNIYASALPFFYSLDKDLRALIFLHIHIRERGIAVLLMPIAESIHSGDPWDTKRNAKVEEQESKRIQRNPSLSFRYNRLSTFVGYLYYGDMTENQRNIYEAIKTEKRAKVFESQSKTKDVSFIDKVYKALIEGRLTKELLTQMCLIEGLKPSSITSQLNRRLGDEGRDKTLKYFLNEETVVKQTPSDQVESLVPSF